MNAIRPAARAVLLLAVAGTSGCAHRYGELHGVTVGDRVASAAEVGDLQFVREGEAKPATVGMPIRKADELGTPTDMRALLFLDAGYEVVLDANTSVMIENPSIRVRLGRLFAKVVGEVREALTVHSEFTTAAVQGTEFIFEVAADSTTTIRVLEGRVTAESADGRYPTVTYGPLEGGTFRRDRPPQRMRDLDPAEARRLTAWAREVERLTVVNAPGVLGLPEQEARAVIEREGFRVLVLTGSITGQAAGTVVGQSPSAGEPQRPGATIIITVEPPSVRVPDVAGMPRDRAEQRLRDAGLRPRFTVQAPDSAAVLLRTVATQVVVGTDPPAGRPVAPRSEIEVTLRGGAAPMCTMPDLMRRDEKTARSLLADARFSNVRFEQGAGTTVTFQSIDARRTVACTTPVTVRIGNIIR